MKEEKIVIGCLPILLLYIILFVLRLTVAPGKSWEQGIALATNTVFIIGLAYMLLVLVINKSNQPITLSRQERLESSITRYKNSIEKFIDTNGKFTNQYKIDNSEYLSYQLAEFFHAQKELSYCKSRGWSFNPYSFDKKSDHEKRRKILAKIIKEKGLSGFVFWGGLYEGQAYHIYHGIGECETSGCYNSVDEDWHKLCHSCFLNREYL